MGVGEERGTNAMFGFSPIQFPDGRSVMELAMLVTMTPMLVTFSAFQSGRRMTELIWMNTLLYKVSC